MIMGYYIKLYLATLAIFFAVDMLWLGVVARGLYKKHLGFLMAPEINWWAAIVFYLLFIAAVLFFVVIPGLKEQDLLQTLIRAAFFGFITYATYDLTNLATVKEWPLTITIIDPIWGTVLTTLVSLGGYLVGSRLS